MPPRRLHLTATVSSCQWLLLVGTQRSGSSKLQGFITTHRTDDSLLLDIGEFFNDGAQRPPGSAQFNCSRRWDNKAQGWPELKRRLASPREYLAAARDNCCAGSSGQAPCIIVSKLFGGDVLYDKRLDMQKMAELLLDQRACVVVLKRSTADQSQPRRFG